MSIRYICIGSIYIILHYRSQKMAKCTRNKMTTNALKI